MIVINQPSPAAKMRFYIAKAMQQPHFESKNFVVCGADASNVIELLYLARIATKT